MDQSLNVPTRQFQVRSNRVRKGTEANLRPKLDRFDNNFLGRDGGRICTHIRDIDKRLMYLYGIWYPSSRVRICPKPLDFSGVRIILSMPSFGGEVKICPMSQLCGM